MDIFELLNRAQPQPPGSLLTRLKESKSELQTRLKKVEVLIAKLENDPELENILESFR